MWTWDYTSMKIHFMETHFREKIPSKTDLKRYDAHHSRLNNQEKLKLNIRDAPLKAHLRNPISQAGDKYIFLSLHSPSAVLSIQWNTTRTKVFWTYNTVWSEHTIVSKFALLSNIHLSFIPSRRTIPLRYLPIHLSTISISQWHVSHYHKMYYTTNNTLPTVPYITTHGTPIALRYVWVIPAVMQE